MKTQKAILLLVILGCLSACKQVCGLASKDQSQPAAPAVEAQSTSSTSTNCVVEEPSKGEDPSRSPADEEKIVDAYHPLLWEAVRKDGPAWSAHLHKVIEDELATDLLPGSSDVEIFCPRYHTLNNHQRINFWGMLISAITKYESGFNPLSRYHESSMGTDPVTQKPVYSEGLLQLSYQDTKWATYCEFNWSLDKNLAATDPKKTILDPYKNLSCGVKIFARQIRNKRHIAVSSGAYWAVLIPGGRYGKVVEISKLTKQMPGCQ